MYINPYWAGVLTAVGAELLLIVGWAFIKTLKEKK